MGILTIEKKYGYGWYRVYNICFLLLNLHFFLVRKFLTMCSSPCTGHEALQKKTMGFQASSLEPSDTWQSSRGWQRYARGKTVRIHRPPSFRRKWQQIMPQEHFVHWIPKVKSLTQTTWDGCSTSRKFKKIKKKLGNWSPLYKQFKKSRSNLKGSTPNNKN